jgi:hypothetical protein
VPNEETNRVTNFGSLPFFGESRNTYFVKYFTCQARLGWITGLFAFLAAANHARRRPQAPALGVRTTHRVRARELSVWIEKI